MQSLRHILKTFITDYGLKDGIALKAIRSDWAEIVGNPIAAHTFPDTIKGRVLNLVVDTPQWMHHLSFFKAEIIERLKSFAVDDIRFRIGRLPEQIKEDPSTDQACLNEDDERYIDNTLKNIQDEELREKFRTLIVHGLTKGKK